MNKNRLWEYVTSVEWPIRFVGVVYGILKGIVEMLPIHSESEIQNIHFAYTTVKWVWYSTFDLYLPENIH